MKYLAKYWFVIAIAAFVGYSVLSNDGDNYVEDDIDLNKVLDVTVETLYQFNDATEAQAESDRNADAAFIGFAEALEVNYNAAEPVIYTERISVQPNADSSLMAYVEKNGNAEYDSGSEEALFLIEIDGENARIIASSRSGAINDHRFSGTGLLAGYLVGSMLTRQRAAGASPAHKTTRTAAQAARARAGSGSHSRGK